VGENFQDMSSWLSPGSGIG